MDVITTAIVANAAYDIVKQGLLLSTAKIKEKLSKWAISDSLAEVVASELAKLEINDEVSEKFIERQLNQSQKMIEIIATINTSTPKSSTTINQIHSGNGDNIGRDRTNN